MRKIKMIVTLSHSYKNLISIDNLILAWEEFIRGKRKKADVQNFQFNLMDNILSLHYDLSNKCYHHREYKKFIISDTKTRTINKASVRDRLLHRAVYRVLYLFFDKTFIANSFSCRNGKGTHKAVNRFRSYGYTVSKNNTKTCWILKCDIKKFFANIDQQILIDILNKRIKDKDIVCLLKEIIASFDSGRKRVGLPLGNLTSQLFANVYMNEFDQFIKHKLKIKYYIRYADDFVVLSDDKNYLERIVPEIKTFLYQTLRLKIHQDKICIKTLSSGVDFLGWVNFYNHRILRTKTKKRMFRKLKENNSIVRKNSYLGLLRYGNTYKLQKII